MTEKGNNIKIRMLRTVMPDIGFFEQPADIILFAGKEYEAVSNLNGAISGICENGKQLGVRPGEFEFIEAPEWVLKLWIDKGYITGDLKNAPDIEYPGGTEEDPEV